MRLQEHAYAVVERIVIESIIIVISPSQRIPLGPGSVRELAFEHILQTQVYGDCKPGFIHEQVKIHEEGQHSLGNIIVKGAILCPA